MSKGHRFLFRNPEWFRGHGHFFSFKHHLRKLSQTRSSRDVLPSVTPFVHGRTPGLKFSIKIKQRFALKACTWGMQNVFPIKAFFEERQGRRPIVFVHQSCYQMLRGNSGNPVQSKGNGLIKCFYIVLAQKADHKQGRNVEVSLEKYLEMVFWHNHKEGPHGSPLDQD